MTKVSEAKVLRQNGDLDGAIELLRRIPSRATTEEYRFNYWLLKADILFSLERYLDAVTAYKQALNMGRGQFKLLDMYEAFRLQLHLADCYLALGLVFQSFEIYLKLSGLSDDILPGNYSSERYYKARSFLGQAKSLCILVDNKHLEEQFSTLFMGPTITLERVQRLIDIALPIFEEEGSVERYSAMYTRWLMHVKWFNGKEAAETLLLLASQKTNASCRTISLAQCILLASQDTGRAEMEAFIEGIQDPVVKAEGLRFIALALINKNPLDPAVLPILKQLVEVLEPTQEIGNKISHAEWILKYLSKFTPGEAFMKSLSDELHKLQDSIKDL